MIELGNELNYQRYSSYYQVGGTGSHPYVDKIVPLCRRRATAAHAASRLGLNSP